MNTEELAEAIYSLKTFLEEMTYDTSKLAFVEPSPLEKFTQSIGEVEEKLTIMTEYLGDLTTVMEEILKVQQKALKWQEMFG